MIKDKTYFSRYGVAFKQSRNFSVEHLISVDKPENKPNTLFKSFNKDKLHKPAQNLNHLIRIKANKTNNNQKSKNYELPNTREELMALIKSKPLFKHNKTFSNFSLPSSENNLNYVKNIYPVKLFEDKTKLLKISNSTGRLLKSNMKINKNILNLYGRKSEIFQNFKIKTKKFDNMNIEVSDSSEDEMGEEEYISKFGTKFENNTASNTVNNVNVKSFTKNLKIPKIQIIPEIIRNNLGKKVNPTFRSSFSQHPIRDLKTIEEFRKMSTYNIYQSVDKLNNPEYFKDNPVSSVVSNPSDPTKHLSHFNFKSFNKKETFIRLDANKKLAEFLEKEETQALNKVLEPAKTNANIMKSSRLDINAIDFNQLSKNIEKQMNPYMKYLKFNKLKKFDYLFKIDNGDIIKEVFELNFMNKLIPGNFLNYDNENLKHIITAQPRFIKNKFKRASVDININLY